MRVLHTNFHLGWGGQAARVFFLCRKLLEMGVDVTVAAPSTSVLVKRCNQAGIPVLDNVRFSKGFRPIDFAHDVRVLRRFISANRIEILHTHGSQDTWSGCTAKALCKRKPSVVRTRHNTFPVHYSIHNRILHRRLIDWLVVVSDSVIERYSRFIESGIISLDRVTTIHSSIQVERYDPKRVDQAAARAQLNIHPDASVISVAARLAREKGHKYLLEALVPLRAEFPNILLLLAGEGDQERALKAYSRELGIESNVRFLGFTGDVPLVQAAADVSVLPSIDCDASSAAIKEAMAMERPVVATRIGGASEILDDGTDGLVVPPGDSEALAEALSHLLNDPELRQAMGAAARKKVVERYTEARLAEQTLAVYERMIAECGGSGNE
ncbi:glycosyltransferase family 4 protein [bacterium]|nr:glycosyltransferase family 4 protein [bacterium]